MNIQLGGKSFNRVKIPLLWGKRAVLVDHQGRLSILDLSGPDAKLEILGDQPAIDVEYSLNLDGFTIKRNGTDIYRYVPKEKILSPISLRLPECLVTPSEIRVGGNFFTGDIVADAAVGLVVNEYGVDMSSVLPSRLSRFIGS